MNRSAPPILNIYEQKGTENLNYIGTVTDYLSLMWDSYFCDMGRIQFVVPATAENYRLLNALHFVVRQDTNEVAIITTVQDTYNENKKTINVVARPAAEWYLSCRSVQTCANSSLYYTILHAIGVNEKDRYIDVTASATDAVIPWKLNDEIKNKYTYFQLIQKIGEKNNIGFKSFYDGKRVNCTLYDGTDRTTKQKDVVPVVFSENTGLLKSANYEETHEGVTNRIYVLCHKTDDVPAPDGYPYICILENGYIAEKFENTILPWDVSDKIIFCDPYIVENGTEKYVDYELTRGQMIHAAQDVFKQPTANYSIDIANGEYGHTFIIGDKVTYKDINRNTTVDLRVTAACETYDSTGYTCSITLGTKTRTLQDYTENLWR